MDHVLGYLWLVVVFGNLGALLWLQVSALRRHRELSFALLCASTVLAGLYYFVSIFLPHLFSPRASPPRWYYPLFCSLLVAQVVLGLWGTAKLFHRYAALRTSTEDRRRSEVEDQQR